MATYYLGLLIAGVFGAIFGSYSTLFAHRIPINESCFGRYFGQKSRCPECNIIIRTRDLIPLFNWLFTLGKCSSCKARIPRSHLFIEVATTILFMICYVRFSFGEEFLLYSLLSSALIVIVVIDYKYKIFPNQVLNVILIISLVNRVLVDQTIINAVFSVVFGFIFATIFYQIFYKKLSDHITSQEQILSYSKFIIITSISLDLMNFFLYFLSIILIFVFLVLFNKSFEKKPIKKNQKDKKDRFGKRKVFTFGFSLILPFIWLMLYPI